MNKIIFVLYCDDFGINKGRINCFINYLSITMFSSCNYDCYNCMLLDKMKLLNYI